MRKIILVSLVALIVLITGALTITWFYRAHDIKKNIEIAFSSIAIGDTKITYDDIVVSGFPTAMNVTIIKPHIVMNVTEFADKISLEKTLKINKLPQWNEDITIDGDMKLSVNMFSNKFQIQTNGNIISKSNIAGKDLGLIAQSTAPTVCELTTSNHSGLFGNLWNFRAWMNDTNNFLHDLRSIDCVTPPFTMLVAANNEKAVSSGGGRFYISRDPQKEISSIRVYLLGNDIEATKAYDAIYITYLQAIANGSKFISPSTYGKQNIEIDFSYSGTEDWNNPNAKQFPLEVKINKLHISNAAYQLDSTLSLSNNYKDNARNISLNYKMEATATDLLRNLLRSHLNDVTTAITTTPIANNETNREIMEARKRVSMVPPEKMDQLINSIIPDFAHLGKMTAAINIDYKGDDKLNSYNANLSGFELSAAPYGIIASGTGKRSGNQSPMSGNLSIICNNCTSLIDNSISYLRELHDGLAILSSNKLQDMNISDETIEGVKAFLMALNPDGFNGNKNNLKFDIAHNGQTFSVNGKGVVEIAQIFGKTIAPTLPKNAMQIPAPKSPAINEPAAKPPANNPAAAQQPGNKPTRK